jgi:hypothetical protein
VVASSSIFHDGGEIKTKSLECAIVSIQFRTKAIEKSRVVYLMCESKDGEVEPWLRFPKLVRRVQFFAPEGVRRASLNPA